jgi:hypothetical protein
MSIATATLMFLLVVSGCATKKPLFQPASVPEERALVYLYNPQYSGTNVRIEYQENRLVTLHPGEYFVHTPDPGEVAYVVPAHFDLSQALTGGIVEGDSDHDQVTRFQAQAGHKYYFKLAGRSLFRVDNETASRQIVTCRLTGS